MIPSCTEDAQAIRSTAHEPEASHLLMLEAIAGRAAIGRSYDEALRGLYLWHEFGDTHLILPAEDPHTEHCSSN